VAVDAEHEPKGIIMSQATAAKKSSMPAWMVLAGVLTAIAGWMTRNYAASQMHRAIYLAPTDVVDKPTIEGAISLGYIGLGLIIFGAALFLAGLVVVALRR
jgi:hypothetical protein